MDEMKTFTVTYTSGDSETLTPTIADMFKASRAMREEKSGTFGEDGLETAVYLMYYAHKRQTGDTRDFETWLECAGNFTVEEDEAPKADY